MFTAKHRHAALKPRKARLVMDMVRGMGVDEALALLKRQPQRAARMIEKVVASAQANAESRNFSGELFVIKAVVDEGMMIKRFRPGSRGRSSIIRHRRAHLTVEVGPDRIAGALRDGQRELRREAREKAKAKSE